MSELGKRIRDEVRAAVENGGGSQSTNVVSAVNVGGEHHWTAVHQNEDETVITHDGRTEIVRHREQRQ